MSNNWLSVVCIFLLGLFLALSHFVDQSKTRIERLEKVLSHHLTERGLQIMDSATETFYLEVEP